MKTVTYAIVALLVALTLAACQSRERTGALIGGATGAVAGETLGDGTTATVLGALGGAAAGYFIGERLDQEDRQQLAEVLEQEPAGETVNWTDPDTGTRYQVTPTATFQREGQPCRNFTLEAADEEVATRGTACRTAGGDWQIVG